MKTQFVYTGAALGAAEQQAIDSLPAQASGIVNIVKSAPVPVEKSVLEQAISADGRGKRVLSYYKSKLVELGLIREEIAGMTVRYQITGDAGEDLSTVVSVAKYGTLGRSAVVVGRDPTGGYAVWLFHPQAAQRAGKITAGAEASLSLKNLQFSPTHFDGLADQATVAEVCGKPVKWLGAKTAARSAASKKILQAQ